MAAPRKRKAKRQRAIRREIAEPRASFEELEIRTSDGASLRALVDDPPEGVALRGTLVFAHAMFAEKSSFGLRATPGLSSVLTARGFRTIAFDFRGHGDSTPPARDWSYDDLVRRDLPTVVEYARAHDEERPLVVVGHALGGQIALAARGMDRIGDIDAIVLLATNVWLRELEPSRLRWGAKRAIAHLAFAAAAQADDIGALIRKVPAIERPLRHILDRVSADTSSRHARELFGGVIDGRWRSVDEEDDYLAALERVKVPVAAVLGDRDRIACHPSAGEAFVRRCRGGVEVFRAPVGHREIVTSPRAWPCVALAVEWAVAQARP